MSVKQLKYIDFFSGIGGFRLGLQYSKLRHYVPISSGYCDIDQLCKKMYENYFEAEAEPFYSDITELSSIGAKKPKVHLDDFDLFLGGFPCQPFANIGKQSGLEDERGSLIYHICDLLERYQPKFFILENVQKMRNLKSGLILDQVLKLLSSSGYAVWMWDLCASDYGVPQQRRRIFFCGVRSSPDVVSDIGPPSTEGIVRKYPTTWHLLEKKMPSEHLIPDKTRMTVLRRNDKWQGDMAINRLLARPLTATMAKWHRANQDNYYSEKFVFASDIEEAMHYSGYDEDEPIRRITFIEGLRLQGFPDDYIHQFNKFEVRPTPGFRIIGNAVPTGMVSAVCERFFEVV